MISDAGTASIYADFSGFEGLRVKARENSPDAIKEVASQFEAMFIQMMLKSMRDASLSEGAFDSQQTEFYQGMFDQQIAMDLSSKNSLGIADMMMRQLGYAEETQPGAVTTRLQNFETPTDFVETLRPLAEQAAAKLDISPDILIAQAALETGWGNKIIQSDSGKNSHNLFGIKAGAQWQGDSVSVETLEFKDGIAARETANFRAYDSYAESFNDYVEFLNSNGRYQQALNSGVDSENFIRSLQDSGYATDPEYANKIMSILDRKMI